MALAGFISKIVQSITRTTFQFNKTLDVLISRFKDSCPPTRELLGLIKQKNQINNALMQIEGKIATLNKLSSTAEGVVTSVKGVVTIIKSLPIPTSVPPGVGIPLNIINTFSDALDTLGTIIDKEEGSLDSIPEALDLISKDVSSVITKLNDLDVALNNCLEKDPAITQTELNSVVATTGNFVDILTNEALTEILNKPPGLLYGDYYLRLNYVNVSQTTLNAYNEDILEGEVDGVYGDLFFANSISIAITSSFSFDKKQIIAQNKESVPPPGEYYNPNVSVEMLYGDESFSSTNIVLVDEMKWHIDIKDLIFPPPPPAEDPLKAIQKASQVTIFQAIYGANLEEAEELYELAWELSQNKGPTAWYYNTLVEEAFDNSRTILEQAVANEGHEWKEGNRILDSTIKNLFLGGIENENEKKGYISLIRKQANDLRILANQVGGNYAWHSRRWSDDGNFILTSDARLYPYSERLAVANEGIFNDATIGLEFIDLRPIMHKRKRRMQAIFEVANYLSLQNSKIGFNDPLKEYFISKNLGYSTPIINGIPIIGNQDSPITIGELESLYPLEQNMAWDILQGSSSVASGLSADNVFSYSKTKIFLKLKAALGIEWYNAKALFTSELPFWYLKYPNTTPGSYPDDNNPNQDLNPSDEWYFEFGRNGLPIPTGS